ncbi:MAG: substrate-binding domain-containing protein [Defluviitaleaceae bacterium]|nr:substrate-binding domain-containing protein [Defluviitaleaceae bacterium]
MKKTKLAVLVFVLACLGVVFVACGDDAAPAPTGGGGGGGAVAADVGAPHAVIENVSDLRVGFSIKNRHNPYLIAMYETMQEEARRHGFQLSTRNAGGDAVQQQVDVESLIAAGVDVIVMDAQDPVAAIAKSEYIASHGIPLFLMNATVDPASIFVTLIQSNNVGLGSAVGEWVADQIDGDIRIGLLSGNPGNMVGFARRNGFIQGISERQLATMNSTNFIIRSQGWGNWSAEGGLSAAEDMLVAAPDINVIFAENDAKAMGAITAVQNAGRAGEVLVVGIDGMRDALEMIQDGHYGATGVNSPIELVRLSMNVMVDYMTGVNRNIPSLINTTPGIVHGGNVGQSWDLAF